MSIKLKTLEEFRLALSKAKDTLMVVDFFASYCGPCRMLAPKFEELSEKYGHLAVFYNSDIVGNSETSEANGITAMPTFILFRDGKKVDELVGVNVLKLEDVIKKNLGLRESQQLPEIESD